MPTEQTPNVSPCADMAFVFNPDLTGEEMSSSVWPWDGAHCLMSGYRLTLLESGEWKLHKSLSCAPSVRGAGRAKSLSVHTCGRR